MTNFDLTDCFNSADIDENHEKDRERKERLAQSNKARAKRKLVKDKRARQHEAGFGGNV